MGGEKPVRLPIREADLIQMVSDVEYAAILVRAMGGIERGMLADNLTTIANFLDSFVPDGVDTECEIIPFPGRRG